MPGASVVCLQELTLSPYFAVVPRRTRRGRASTPEPLPGGPTYEFAAGLAAEFGVHVHASLYEAPGGDAGGLGFNTAICVAPDGALVARTRKLHIPQGRRLPRGPLLPPREHGLPGGAASPGAEVGFPTCWDQWFPEVARSYSLAGAEVLVFPTAIGSEPDLPGFDTQPLWQNVIVGERHRQRHCSWSW